MKLSLLLACWFLGVLTVSPRAQYEKTDLCGFDAVLIPSVATRLDAAATRLASLRILDQEEFEELQTAFNVGRPMPMLGDLFAEHETWEDFSKAATAELRDNWPASVSRSKGMLLQCVPPEAVSVWAQRREECARGRQGLDAWVTAVDDGSVTVACYWSPTWGDESGLVTHSEVVGGYRDDSTVPDMFAFHEEAVLESGEVQRVRFYRAKGEDFRLRFAVRNRHAVEIEVPWIEGAVDEKALEKAPVRGAKITFDTLQLSSCDHCKEPSGARFGIAAIARGKSEEHRETRRTAGDVSSRMTTLPVTNEGGEYVIDKTMLAELKPYDELLIVKGTLHTASPEYVTQPTPFEISLQRVMARWVEPRSTEVRNLSGSHRNRVKWRGTLKYTVEFIRF